MMDSQYRDSISHPWTGQTHGGVDLLAPLVEDPCAPAIHPLCISRDAKTTKRSSKLLQLILSLTPNIIQGFVAFIAVCTRTRFRPQDIRWGDWDGKNLVATQKTSDQPVSRSPQHPDSQSQTTLPLLRISSSPALPEH